eukprot:Nitzschia sp. Nitz4//scaffold192_size41448//7391//11414//NITZ4_007481-RA/size41448-processed-gene-0.55-mRNA-1//1//CDS//3329540224//7529//frame0
MSKTRGRMRECLKSWASKQIAQGLSCTCPASGDVLEVSQAEEGVTTTVEGRHLQALPLEQAQPLAHQLLALVQVRYDVNDNNLVGDYGDIDDHLLDNNVTSTIAPPMGHPPLPQPNNGGSTPQPQYTYDDGSRVGATTRGEATGAHHGRTLPLHSQQPAQVDHLDLQRAMERCDKLKKQANAKFNRGDIEGARLLYSEGLALISHFPVENDDVRVMTASLFSNRAVTFFRERILEPSIQDCDQSLALDPKSEKTYIRKWRALSALGNTEGAIQCLRDGLNAMPESSKISDELRRATGPPQTPSSTSHKDAHMDMSYSIAEMSRYDDQSRAHEMDLSVVGDPSPAVMDRVERLKKQANAKFNRGDIENARNFYSDAIGCFPQNHNLFSQGVRSVVAALYSNRAVTYFRDKMYEESLEDCEKAIELDKRGEKQYIRKARALVGMERHSEALKCLREACALLPASEKLQEELRKAIQEAPERPESTRSGGFEALAAADSDFNASVSSINFFVANEEPVGRAGVAAQAPVADYAEELELADKLKRNANAKFNRGDIAGARLIYTEALACLPNDRDHEEVRACLASLYANRAVTYFREKEFRQSTWDCDKALELEPRSEKPYIRKARALTELRSFKEAIACLEVGLREVGSSARLQEELDKAHELLAEAEQSAPNGDKGEGSSKDFQVSSSSFDFNANASAVSGTYFVSPTASSRPALDSVAEGATEDFSLPYSDRNEDLEKAEKLKKQANAKLNKEDVAGARVLYGEGIACLPAGGPNSTEGRELAAGLYANRAVTFFREKKFAATVADCDKSLEFDPRHEKSYIRKWRALMALGNFDDAFKCLEGALQELPDSERLNEEFGNAKEQRDLLATVKVLLDKGEYQEARDTLKPVVKNSDNVSLWLVAAQVDACLGFTESALERVNKVLSFNPKHAEALRIRGYAMFLSGEMDHGINLLKEALETDIENENRAVSRQLEDCERILASFGKGQARVKRGRYKEAVDLFTSAVEDVNEIPPDSPLYGLLLTERAEANLLSHKYEDALQDCLEAIRLKNDNTTAWTVKVEVYFALGRLQEARDELAEVRQTWGAGNDTIEDAFKKTDFELRLKKADDDLYRIAASVDSGIQEEM